MLERCTCNGCNLISVTFLVEKKRFPEVIYPRSDSVFSSLMGETLYFIKTLLTENEMLFITSKHTNMHLVCESVDKDTKNNSNILLYCNEYALENTFISRDVVVT